MMISAVVKLAILIGAVVITSGFLPDRRKGALLAIGTCVVIACILHFAAP